LACVIFAFNECWNSVALGLLIDEGLRENWELGTFRQKGGASHAIFFIFSGSSQVIYSKNAEEK